MCECITEMNALLAPHNGTLVTTMFRKPDVVTITTAKIDSKKRGNPPIMVASYCPFCGSKYEAA